MMGGKGGSERGRHVDANAESSGLAHQAAAPPGKHEGPRDGVEGRGRVIAFDREPGGRPSGNRLTSGSLRLSALLVDRSAQISGGLVSLTGGGWSFVALRTVPARVDFPVTCLVEAGGVPAGEYTLVFELLNPSWKPRTRRSLAVAVDVSGDLLRIPLAFDLPATIDAFGIWRIVVRSDIAELGAIDVLVKRDIGT